jgi:hypothetical protein
MGWVETPQRADVEWGPHVGTGGGRPLLKPEAAEFVLSLCT